MGDLVAAGIDAKETMENILKSLGIERKDALEAGCHLREERFQGGHAWLGAGYHHVYSAQAAENETPDMRAEIEADAKAVEGAKISFPRSGGVVLSLPRLGLFSTVASEKDAEEVARAVAEIYAEAKSRKPDLDAFFEKWGWMDFKKAPIA